MCLRCADAAASGEGLDCVKAACAAAACVALGREVTADCFDGLMRTYTEGRCLDLTGVGGQLVVGVGSQLSEGALAELGALCPDVQAVFCPRRVRLELPERTQYA